MLPNMTLGQLPKLHSFLPCRKRRGRKSHYVISLSSKASTISTCKFTLLSPYLPRPTAPLDNLDPESNMTLAYARSAINSRKACLSLGKGLDADRTVTRLHYVADGNKPYRAPDNHHDQPFVPVLSIFVQVTSLRVGQSSWSQETTSAKSQIGNEHFSLQRWHSWQKHPSSPPRIPQFDLFQPIHLALTTSRGGFKRPKDFNSISDPTRREQILCRCRLTR